MRARTGEHGVSGKNLHKKVDLIVQRAGVDISRSEFARFSSRTSKKFWRDRSKILRLAEDSHNNLEKFSKSMTMALQVGGLNANLLGLDHIDHGLYAANASTEFAFPEDKDEIIVKMPRALCVLFYFKVFSLYNY
ncbi:hypothetical protein HK096_004128 [Nowakowskiella sp. JEL0078]|nr:hypothetical protein HK096_004128 [Nowakowskiella sp. JEL0078]